ncbi:cell wall protein DAN4-like [Hyalella azteca]|uniref:Cell wall protein DAN4-like n=1 Tax=Hyalella azteca TaxID=294128 RepID=A0A979FHH8_HYAAZ|nr:cell wall protein DAN4-like [Hyalella azteca]
MSFLGSMNPTVSFPPSSSQVPSNKALTPPASPRHGVFTSYNPSLSPKNNYNPYQPSLKSPTLLPCSMPVPLHSTESSGAVTPVTALANGTTCQEPSGAAASTVASPSNLYESLLMKASSIISANRSFSSDSPPGSPKLAPIFPFSSSPPISSPSSSSTSRMNAAMSSSNASTSSPCQKKNDSNNNSRSRQTNSTTTTTSTTNCTTTITCSGTTCSPAGIRPPVSIINVSPYKYQLRAYLYPRHITTEHVVFSHRTKVAGRSLYFFSPATRGGLSKPVFTTRETLAHMLDPGAELEEADDLESTGRLLQLSAPAATSRLSQLSSPVHVRRRRSGDLLAGTVCTMKRVHLHDPACDLGISVWRGRGPREGLPAPHSPPTPLGPALLVEAVQQRDGQAVAAAVSGDVLFRVPARPDLEARSTEINVRDAVIVCVGEGVVWYRVRSYTPLTRSSASPLGERSHVRAHDSNKQLLRRICI